MTALGALLAAAGALRGELASLAWGSSFLLLALYSLAGCHLYGLLLRRHLRRRPDPLDCLLPALGGGVFAGQEAEARVSAEMPRAAVPGFTLELLLPLHFQGAGPGRPPLMLRCPLQRGSTTRTLRLPCPHRGSYASSQGLIAVADRLGFTRGVSGLSLQETLRVYPSLAYTAALQAPLREGGRRLRRLRRRPSEELLEVRRYFPGDDIRRLHWKVFAHTRELFLRMGEESPPPSSRFLVLLDVCPCAAVPAELAADHLDGMVEACFAAVRELPPGAEALFAASCEPAARPAGREALPELLNRLAALWWDDRLSLRLADADRRLQVLLYSTPGSANISPLVRSLGERDCALLLLLKGLPEPAPGQVPGEPWRRLFLRSPGGGAPAANGRRRQAALRAFDEALEAALEYWGRRLRGMGRAQRI